MRFLVVSVSFSGEVKILPSLIRVLWGSVGEGKLPYLSSENLYV